MLSMHSSMASLNVDDEDATLKLMWPLMFTASHCSVPQALWEEVKDKSSGPMALSSCLNLKTKNFVTFKKVAILTSL